MKFCPECGTQLNDEARFCAHCGAQSVSSMPQADSANSTHEKATMPISRLIKRSTILERRLAGNIFTTVAIDKDDNIIGCGCNKLYNFPQKGYVALSSYWTDIFAVSNTGDLKYESLTPYSDELMPHCTLAFSYHFSTYNIKRIVYEGMVIAAVYRNGKVAVGGYCEAGEEAASWWTDIDDIELFENGILGITKTGNILLCGAGARQYQEMTTWTDIARVKPIHENLVGFAHESFVGLKNDGTLLYCGTDKAFAKQIANYQNVVSFDGLSSNGIMHEFYVVLSDGSMKWYHLGNDLIPTFNKDHYKKDFLAVNYLPSGAHFIKQDGSIETHVDHHIYPSAVSEALITLTGKAYNVVSTAMHNAEHAPLSEKVSGWKLFDDPNEILRRYEAYEDNIFVKNQKCAYCGGDFSGFLSKKCVKCGKKKNY